MADPVLVRDLDPLHDRHGLEQLLVTALGDVWPVLPAGLGESAWSPRRLGRRSGSSASRRVTTGRGGVPHIVEEHGARD